METKDDFAQAWANTRPNAIARAKEMRIEAVVIPSDEVFSVLGYKFSRDAVELKENLQGYWEEQLPALLVLTVRWLWYSAWYAALRLNLQYSFPREPSYKRSGTVFIHYGPEHWPAIGTPEGVTTYEGWADCFGQSGFANDIETRALAIELAGSQELPTCPPLDLMFELVLFYFYVQATENMKAGKTERAIEWLYEAARVREISAWNSAEVIQTMEQRALRSKGGKKRHQTAIAAREMVRLEWEKNGKLFPSKSAFTRQIGKKIIEQFGEGFTEKTIREQWLASPPPA
jgi:hypothetical protein